MKRKYSAEDYQLRVWEDNDMKTMKEFLVWYNKDVVPMIEALEKMLVLTITKTRSEVIGDVKELQLLCLDGHKSVVALHGVLDEVTLGQVQINSKIDEDLKEFSDEEKEKKQKDHHLYQLGQKLERFLHELPVFFGTAVSFQVLTITKTSSEVIGDVKELQLLCLDGHKSVGSLFQYIEKRKYLCRRLPDVPDSMGRQRHEDHERVPDLVQQQGRSPDARGPRKDVLFLYRSYRSLFFSSGKVK
jgi:hypothetical protein